MIPFSASDECWIPADQECLGQVSTDIFSFSHVSKMSREAPSSSGLSAGETLTR